MLPHLDGSLRYMCMTSSCYDLLQSLQQEVQQLSKHLRLIQHQLETSCTV